MLGNDCKHQNKNISKFNPTLLYVQFNVQYSKKLVPGLKSEKGVGGTTRQEGAAHGQGAATNSNSMLTGPTGSGRYSSHKNSINPANGISIGSH